MSSLNNSLNMFIAVLLNSVLSKLFSRETNIMGLIFFVGESYHLAFSYCLHICDGDRALVGRVRTLVMYFNTVFYSPRPEV